MIEARAFSPCHITGVFQIFDETLDPLFAGSRGAGVSLASGVETNITAEKTAKTSIQTRINNSPTASAEVSRHVVRSFLSQFTKGENFTITVEHKVHTPIGAGFGTSGAGALSLALALNEAFGSSMSRTEAAQLAHVAEVECKTGLGTVIAETYGGAEIRVKPGAPGVGKIEQIPASKDLVATCLTFGKLSTTRFLADKQTRKRVNEYGGALIDKLIEKPSIDSFLRYSREFSDHVGLASDRLCSVMDLAEKAGFVCSMQMFGESIFTLTNEDSRFELARIFQEVGSGGTITVSEIDFEGARVL